MYMIILHLKRNNMKNPPLIMYYLCIITGILLFVGSIGTERLHITGLAILIIIRSIILTIRHRKSLENNKE